MRKGAGGEHCLVFSIREVSAGRLYIPMDNVCSAFQKASIFIMRKGLAVVLLLFSIRKWEAGRHRSQGTMPAQPARLPLA